MNHLSLVIKREYLTKIRNKSFVIMTFLSPLIMVGIFALVAYLSQLNNEKIRVIDVLDESGLFAGYLEGTENMSFQMISEQISLEEAKRNSPLLHLPNHGCPLIISYGASETSEFKRQSELLADAWKSKGWEVDIFEHPERNHFDIVLELSQSESLLGHKVFDLIASH